jgi:hypothetical protein
MVYNGQLLVLPDPMVRIINLRIVFRTYANFVRR